MDVELSADYAFNNWFLLAGGVGGYVFVDEGSGNAAIVDIRVTPKFHVYETENLTISMKISLCDTIGLVPKGRYVNYFTAGTGFYLNWDISPMIALNFDLSIPLLSVVGSDVHFLYS